MLTKDLPTAAFSPLFLYSFLNKINGIIFLKAKENISRKVKRIIPTRVQHSGPYRTELDFFSYNAFSASFRGENQRTTSLR